MYLDLALTNFKVLAENGTFFAQADNYTLPHRWRLRAHCAAQQIGQPVVRKGS